jgi:hypothetical protein
VLLLIIVKRVFVILFAITCLIAGSGLLFREHFCGGEFVEAEVDFASIVPPSDCCSNLTNNEDDDSCCKTKIKLVKQLQDQQANAQQVLPDFIFFDIPLSLATCVCQIPSDDVACEAIIPLQKPPPWPVPLFLEFCNWRI